MTHKEKAEHNAWAIKKIHWHHISREWDSVFNGDRATLIRRHWREHLKRKRASK